MALPIRQDLNIKILLTLMNHEKYLKINIFTTAYTTELFLCRNKTKSK